ncbi:MAG: YqhA family protein [Thiomicrorhabdus sp.]|nr:YqhA family protein [Thiomicrorhabdus sp.]MCF6298826.1 YqhA family protein [Thiomicrorhabdus sp.]
MAEHQKEAVVETACEKKKQGMGEKVFESILWNSRFVVLVAVVASLITAFAIFYLTAIDVYYTISHLASYHSLPDAERAVLKSQTIAHVVGSVDGFLLGAIMLIFALGLYELFISKIDVAGTKHGASNILFINSLDELKDRLAKVIVLILIVMFFEQAIFLKPTESMDLLYYALSILLVSGSLYLSHKAFQK